MKTKSTIFLTLSKHLTLGKNKQAFLCSRLIGVLITALTLFTVSVNVQAQTKYHVKTNGNDNNNGLTWNTAFRTVQKALNAAITNGDTIFVQKGAYYQTAEYSLTANDIKIFGSFNGTETRPEQRTFGPNASDTTILDAQNSSRVFYLVNRTNTTVIDGFKITNGNSNDGGGMQLSYSSPVLRYLIISDNSSTYNGGGMSNIDSSPTLTDVTISGNTANDTNGGGGGMFNYNSSPTLINVTINGNSACMGGGIINNNSSPTIVNVIVSGNSSKSGGGIYNWFSSSPTLINVIIGGNAANIAGGGMINNNSSPTLTNVTISGNSADFGSAMDNRGISLPKLYNSIVLGNSNVSNKDYDIHNYSVNDIPEYHYCLVGGGMYNGYHNGTLWDNNLYDAEDIFVDYQPSSAGAPTTLGDYSLKSGSFAIDKGNNSYNNKGTTDLAGNPRRVNGTIDLGAYEYQGPFKSVTVGAQSGTLSMGVPGQVGFPVTTVGIANGFYPVTITSLPVGVTVQGNVVINKNRGVLILEGDRYTIEDKTKLTLTIDNTTSNIFVLAISPPEYAIEVTQKGLTDLKVGQALTGVYVIYTLTKGMYASSINPADFAVTNLPPGLIAGTAVRASDKEVIVPITGKPVAYNASVHTVTLPVTIPAVNVKGATSAIPIFGSVVASPVAKGDGIDVREAPTVSGTPTRNSITVNAVYLVNKFAEQTVEYAISEYTSVPTSGWRSGTTFTPLMPGIGYYVFARSAESTNFNAGTAQRSGQIFTASRMVTKSSSTSTPSPTIISQTVGTENIGSNELKVYPSPFIEEVHITGAHDESSVTTLRIFNTVGAVVHSQQITSPDEILRLGSLPAGLYFFRLENEGKAVTLKVVKK